MASLAFRAALPVMIAAAVPTMAHAQQATAPAPQGPPTIATPPTIAPASRPSAGQQGDRPAASGDSATGGVSREAPVNGVLYIYGNERCPTDKDGNEIVVCERRSPAEKYRMPKDLRPDTIKPQYQSWAERQQGVLNEGAAGVGSCSTVGSGGASGCARQQFDNWTATKRAERAKQQQDSTPQ